MGQPPMARYASAPPPGQAGWPQQQWHQQPPQPPTNKPGMGSSPAMKPNALNQGASNISTMFF